MVVLRVFLMLLITILSFSNLNEGNLYLLILTPMMAALIWFTPDLYRMTKRKESPLSPEEKQRIIANSQQPAHAANGALAIALISYIAAILYMFNPTPPPVRGLFRAIAQLLIASFGTYGVSIFLILLGSVSALYALISRKKQK